MATKKKETVVITDTTLKNLSGKIEITSAQVKDDFCNYSFDILDGVGTGDTHNVKGKGIIDDDMREAFSKLNVHLACIDDVFKHADIEIENINTMRSHELATIYTVTGVKIKGGEEDLSVVLIGEKYVSAASGRMSLETPKIALDNLSSYHFHKDLKKAVDKVRTEVQLYKEGKYTAVEPEEKEDPNQLKISLDTNSETDFENAKVK